MNCYLRRGMLPVCTNLFVSFSRNRFQLLYSITPKPPVLSNKFRLFLLSLTVLISVFALTQQVHADSSGTTKLFLPIVTSQDGGCALSAAESQLAELLRNDVNQQRSTLGCNPILSQVAQARAEDMARRGYFDHTNPDGLTPNRLVLNAGYVLPKYYPQDGNTIESIAGGTTTPAETWRALMDSPGHRMHIVAEDSFYAKQVDFGVGYVYVPNSQYKHYWVIITAEPGE